MMQCSTLAGSMQSDMESLISRKLLEEIAEAFELKNINQLVEFQFVDQEQKG
jgi:hypothetical protein